MTFLGISLLSVVDYEAFSLKITLLPENKMIKCPKCSAEIKAHDPTCWKCGQLLNWDNWHETTTTTKQNSATTTKQYSAVTTKQCPYCRETVRADAVICRYCQSDLSEPGLLDKPLNLSAAWMLLAMLFPLITFFIGASNSGKDESKGKNLMLASIVFFFLEVFMFYTFFY
jgi:hypothetical protein